MNLEQTMAIKFELDAEQDFDLLTIIMFFLFSLKNVP